MSGLANLQHDYLAEPTTHRGLSPGSILVESFEIMRRRGERAPERLRALSRVIEFYDAWGKPEEAATYRALQGESGP